MKLRYNILLAAVFVLITFLFVGCTASSAPVPPLDDMFENGTDWAKEKIKGKSIDEALSVFGEADEKLETENWTLFFYTKDEGNLQIEVREGIISDVNVKPEIVTDDQSVLAETGFQAELVFRIQNDSIVSYTVGFQMNPKYQSDEQAFQKADQIISAYSTEENDDRDAAAIETTYRRAMTKSVMIPEEKLETLEEKLFQTSFTVVLKDLPAGQNYRYTGPLFSKDNIRIEKEDH